MCRGLRSLQDAGHQVVTLSNGSTEVSDWPFRSAVSATWSTG